jgi:hypothetical protein
MLFTKLSLMLTIFEVRSAPPINFSRKSAPIPAFISVLKLINQNVE